MSERVFESLELFIAHCELLRQKERLADIRARQAVVETVVHTAQNMIGKPSNFAPLAKSTVAERLRLGFSPYATLLRSGDYARSFSWAHVNSRESAAGSTRPDAIYHESGGPIEGRPPRRSVLAEPTRKRDKAYFELYQVEYRLKLGL